MADTVPPPPDTANLMHPPKDSQEAPDTRHTSGIPYFGIHSRDHWVLNGTGYTRPYAGGISVGYWSDKLAMTPYREYLSIGKQGTWQRLVTQLLNESFGIAGRNAEESSRLISRSVRGGVSLYGTASVIPFEVPIHGFRTSLHSSMTTRIDFPEAPFLILFSEDSGLRRGADLPLTHLGMEASIVTGISVSRRFIFPLPSIIDGISRLTHGIIDIDSCAADLGITASLGHLLIEVSTTEGGVHLNDDGSRLYADASFLLQSSGIGVRRTTFYTLSHGNDFPVSGIGAGLDVAMTFFGDHSFITAGVYDVGPMLWLVMRKAETSLRTTDISIEKLLQNDFDLFDNTEGGITPAVDTGEITRPAPPLVRFLPSRCIVGFGYRFDLFAGHAAIRRLFLDHATTAVVYDRQPAAWTGTTPWGECSLLASTAFAGGVLPCRIGWTFGGFRSPASSLATGVTTRSISVCGGFFAAGTPYFFPRKGCTVFLNVTAGAGTGSM